MNTTISKALFTVLASIFLFSTAVADSNETQSQLANCKTFPSKWWNQHSGGSLTIQFEETRGKLNGLIENAKGMTEVDPSGKMKNIKFNGDKITFEVSTTMYNMSYDLELDSENCNLAGEMTFYHAGAGLVITQIRTDRSNVPPARNESKRNDDLTQDKGP